jgi:hypothetical protein
MNGDGVKTLLLAPLREALRERVILFALASAFVFRLALAAIAFGRVHYYADDSASYMDSGINLFTHGSYAIACDAHCIPTLMRPPVYPVLLGLLIAVFKLPIFSICVLQSIFDTVTTWLVAAFGMGLGGRRVAIVAALVYALDPFAAGFAGQIMTESLAALMVMAALYLLWRLSATLGPPKLAPWAGLGAMLGLATLVRPVTGILPLAMALATFKPRHWRSQAVAWVTALVAFSFVIAPWTVRNWLVTRNAQADDSFRIISSVLGPFERRLLTPGVEQWAKSYQEPFVMGKLYSSAPSVAAYLLPNERQRVEALFDKVRDGLGEAPTGVERPGRLAISPELDADFARLARERRAAHPLRAILLPPLSRAVRLWFTPRLSALNIQTWRLGGVLGTFLLAIATAYNGVQALLGIAGGLVSMMQGAAGRILASAPIYLTIFHALYPVGGGQSRYTIPALPEVIVLAALGGFMLIDRAAAKYRATTAPAIN